MKLLGTYIVGALAIIGVLDMAGQLLTQGQFKFIHTMLAILTHQSIGL